jgi:hypothetical protein
MGFVEDLRILPDVCHRAKQMQCLVGEKKATWRISSVLSIVGCVCTNEADFKKDDGTAPTSHPCAAFSLLVRIVRDDVSWSTNKQIYRASAATAITLDLMFIITASAYSKYYARAVAEIAAEHARIIHKTNASKEAHPLWEGTYLA